MNFSYLQRSLSIFSAFNFLKESIKEKRCAVCSAPHHCGDLICPDCAEKIEKIRTKKITETATNHSGITIHSELISGSHDNQAGKLYYFGPYENILRDVILKWKFNCDLGLSLLIKNLICKAALKIDKADLPDLIIPVPLHPSRLRMRGFNQSLELANSVGKLLSCPVASNTLKRIRKTTPQSSLNAKQRQNNLSGAFDVKEESITGRKILLVDDIITTGATIKECRQLLMEKGCLQTDVLVIARTMTK